MTELTQRVAVGVSLALYITAIYHLQLSVWWILGPVILCTLYDWASLLFFNRLHAFSFVLIAYGLAGIYLLIVLFQEDRLQLLLGTLQVALSDVLQYFCGKYLGNREVGRGPSPHKSVEGYLGSILAWPVGMMFGLSAERCLSLIIVGIIGDLFVSWCKRRIGIKDVSDLLGSHGGWLDRTDGVYLGYLWMLLFPSI